MTQIFYLEGDHLWAETFKPQLDRYGLIRVISTEYDFRKAIDELVETNAQFPTITILEQTVRWTNASPNMPTRPPKIREEGPQNAGIRCYDYLRIAQSDSQRTPVIFYSHTRPMQIVKLMKSKGVKDNNQDYQCVEKKEILDELHQAIRRVL